MKTEIQSAPRTNSNANICLIKNNRKIKKLKMRLGKTHNSRKENVTWGFQNQLIFKDQCY